MRILLKVCLAGAILSTGPVFGEDPVHFADETLKACIEENLEIFDPTPSDLSQLIGLSCRHTDIADLTGLDYATNLERLTLSFSEVESIKPLAGLTLLGSLTINDSRIKSISALSDLDRLWDLDAHNNQIQDVSALDGLTQLRLLVLRGNQITDISPLSDMENLSWLDLAGNRIASISPLTAMTNLQSIDLRNMPTLDDQAYRQDLQTLLDNNYGLSLTYDPRVFPSVHLQASQGSHPDHITLTWRPVDNGPHYTSYYRVYGATSAPGAQAPRSEWQQETTFDDFDVSPGVEYEYWIAVAVSAYGEDASLDEASESGWISDLGGDGH